MLCHNLHWKPLIFFVFVLKDYQRIVRCSSPSHIHSNGKGNRTKHLHNIFPFFSHSHRADTFSGQKAEWNSSMVKYVVVPSYLLSCGKIFHIKCAMFSHVRSIDARWGRTISIFNGSRGWKWLFLAWKTLAYLFRFSAESDINEGEYSLALICFHLHFPSFFGICISNCQMRNWKENLIQSRPFIQYQIEN